MQDSFIRLNTLHIQNNVHFFEEIIEERGLDKEYLQHKIVEINDFQEYQEIFIVDNNFQIIAHSKPNKVNQFYKNPDIKKSIKKEEIVYAIETHEEKGKNIRMLDFAFPIRRYGQIIGAGEARISLNYLNNEINSYIRETILYVLLFLLFFIPLSRYYYNRVFSIPLNSLVTATKKVAEGDLDYKMEKLAGKEINMLAKSFNDMTVKLRKSNVDLKHRIIELSTLNKISTAISSTLDLDKVLNMILDDAIKLTNAENGSIMLYDKEKDLLSIEVARGLPQNVIDNYSVKSGEGIAGWVLKNKKPLILESGLQNEINFKGDNSNIKDALSVPLHVQNKIIGVLNISNKYSGTFNQDDLSLLATLANQASNAIENARLYEEIENLYLSTISALAAAVEAKEPYTHGHSERVSRLATRLAEEIGIDENELKGIKTAGLLHDIGKIGISEKILLKPGKLTAKEFGEMKKHPEIGQKILKAVEFPWEVTNPIAQHHERVDGKGYPAGLKSKNISLQGKIITIADSYDAMTSVRPFRKKVKTKNEAIKELNICSGSQFDSELIEVFIFLLENKLISA